MQRKKVLVLTDDLPWGHRSIARAIYGYLKEKEKEANLDVHYLEVKSDMGAANDLYLLAYRYFPQTGKINNMLMEKEIARELLKESAFINYKRVKKAIGWMNPDVVISCYLFHSQSLAKWKKCEKQNFKLITVAADPWTTNPMSYVPEADYHLVYDEVGVKQGSKYGVKKESIVETGWWTRQEMFKPYDRSRVRKRLGINDDRPVIFVGGGSMGTSALPKVLPVLMMINKPIGVVFNSGTDKLAFNMVEEYARMFRNIKKDNLVHIVNLGWIDNMAEILSACDIVFGKAGPNFLFDVIACLKPFVAITHIGGQEDGNIDLIKKKKIGWVREKRKHLTEFFLDYCNNPEKYNEKYLENIKKEAERNRESLPKVLELIKRI